MLAPNSPMENSSPRVSSSSTTPIEAPVETNSSPRAPGAIPPLPSASPASRYSVGWARGRSGGRPSPARSGDE